MIRFGELSAREQVKFVNAYIKNQGYQFPEDLGEKEGYELTKGHYTVVLGVMMNDPKLKELFSTQKTSKQNKEGEECRGADTTLKN